MQGGSERPLIVLSHSISHDPRWRKPFQNGANEQSQGR
jgi:hypothetical protein